MWWLIAKPPFPAHPPKQLNHIVISAHHSQHPHQRDIPFPKPSSRILLFPPINHTHYQNMSRNCGAPSRLIDSPLFNVTELYQQKWEDSPKNDRKRLEKCWGYTDCGDCHRSDGFCGWCAIVSLCFLLLYGGFKKSERRLSKFLLRKQDLHRVLLFMPIVVTENSSGVIISLSSPSPSD
jgi:hypothetical protein